MTTVGQPKFTVPNGITWAQAIRLLREYREAQKTAATK